MNFATFRPAALALVTAVFLSQAAAEVSAQPSHAAPVSSPAPGTPRSAGANELDGVWASERRFGPTIAGGDVILERHGRTWAAAVVRPQRSGFADASSMLHVNGVAGPFATLRFVFHGGVGELRVREPVDGVIAQWVQPKTADGRPRYASPVRLRSVAAGRLRGEIRPLIHFEHLFLVVRTADGGATQAFLRNPEHNLGAYIGLRTVSSSGDLVRLTRPGKRDLTGRYDARRKTLTLPLQIGDATETFVFARATPSDASAFYALPNGAAHYTYRVPSRDGDGWATGSLAGAGIDTRRVVAVMDEIVRGGTPSLRAPYVQSVSIARHGKLVLDDYFYGFDPDRPHDVRSAGKSIATLLVGRAIEDDASLSPQTAVYQLFPEYAPFANDDPRKASITLEHLMTMSAGYACDDNGEKWAGEDAMQSQTAQPDWFKWTLDLPMAFDPGTKAYYCSPEINLLGAIVQKTTRTWLPDYFASRFAAPMQFGRYAMWLTEPPADTAYMAGGDYFRPRDFLKFGQLFLDRGRWHGTQIIDPHWLAELVKPRTAIGGEIGSYGYAWHVIDVKAGKRTYRAFNAGGNGGQLMTVIPELDLAIMITAGNYGQYPVWSNFIEHTIPALAAAAVVPTS
ncbi:MAG TPA: serine hydrolase [Candidatus Elarobacter sp.]|nr:serine hydrolase [Candidatus Elarobacter sp.]